MNLKFRFTIARKLFAGFGLLFLVVILTSILNYRTLDRNLEQNLNVITEVYAPSSAHLNDLYWLVTNTKILIKNWVYIDRKDDTPDKNRLREIHSKDIPRTEKALEELVEDWPNKGDQELYWQVTESIDSLINIHQSIMAQLSSFESYDDMMVTFPIYLQTDQDGEVMVLTNRILEQLNTLIENQEKVTEATNVRMREDFKYLQRLIFIMAIILIIFVIAIGLTITQALVSRVNYLKQIILNMGKGILPKNDIRVSSDEIGEMANALNVLVKGLKKTSEFSLKIGEGDFGSKFEPLSEQDVLGNSLILMRENLQKAAREEEKRKQEDRQRSWAAQGLAKFGEILRMSNDDMEEFSFRIISNLVKYLDANSGGFYIINDYNKEDVYIEMVSCYAYGRKKYMQKRIEIGVNIVGQCVQEKESIYMTDIPQDYIKISSGLGKESPRSLLVVPLKINEEVFGVVEIASFNEFQPYQIEFVEKLGESIASTISSVKINIQTSKLLAESQEKSERLAQQEEVVRQRIEKMKATQNELEHQIEEEKKKNLKQQEDYEDKIQRVEFNLKKHEDKIQKHERELKGYLEAINNTVAAVEYNVHGEFVYANKKFLEMTGMDLENLNGKHQGQFMLKEKVKNIAYQSFWADLNKGISREDTFQYFFNEKEFWLKETFTPVKDEQENVYKIISFASEVKKGTPKAKTAKK